MLTLFCCMFPVRFINIHRLCNLSAKLFQIYLAVTNVIDTKSCFWVNWNMSSILITIRGQASNTIIYENNAFLVIYKSRLLPVEFYRGRDIMSPRYTHFNSSPWHVPNCIMTYVVTPANINEMYVLPGVGKKLALGPVAHKIVFGTSKIIRNMQAIRWLSSY